MIITPKNWKEFQHYKDRAPTWIKLHRAILDDFEFSCLPVASKALAPLLWLLASEYEDGRIDASLDKIAFRVRMTRGDVANALAPLLDSGFFESSEPLADCKQIASLEKERETEVEREKEKECAIAPFDPSTSERDLFSRGKQVLGKTSGGLIAKLKIAKGGNISLARSALEMAATKENPAEYIAAIIRGPPAKPLTEFQRGRRETQEILNDLDRYANGGGSGEEDIRILPGDTSFGPEGIRGGSGGIIVALPSGGRSSRE